MGFTTGMLGGITLTTLLLYTSLHLHTQRRVQQAALLHQQSLILTSIIEPLPPLPPPTARIVRAGLLETAKDRWNAQLESEVRRLQQVDWREVRERMERGVAAVWAQAFEGAEKGVELADEGAQIAGKEVGKGVEKAKVEIGRGVDKVKAEVDKRT